VQLDVLGGGASVVQRPKQPHGAEQAEDKSIIRHHAAIQKHNPNKVSQEESAELKSFGPPGGVKKKLALELSEKSPMTPTSYGHPAWLKNCAVIYLDVGSNIGVQVRKLFEPERYPGAPVLEVFNENIGAPEDRRLPSAKTGLCALGLEPNPAHREHLLSLQDNYTATGWNVHFYPFAAWKDEGQMSFDEAPNATTESWGAKLNATPHPSASAKNRVSIRTVNLADFVTTLPMHSVRLMKVDIEGAEYETVWRMLQQKVLCQGTIDMTFIESHAWGDVTDWQDERTFGALLNRIQKADCGSAGIPTRVSFLDDESFEHDEPDVQAGRLSGHRSMYGFALAVFALAMFIGYQKFQGETILDKIDKLNTPGRGIEKGMA